ncbi:MAG: hypothetical protein JWP07_4595 [Pseudonocardiales bacterium]|nr:hypothetical protein [Pseudonocardiales bacterium]
MSTPYPPPPGGEPQPSQYPPTPQMPAPQQPSPPAPGYPTVGQPTQPQLDQPASPVSRPGLDRKGHVRRTRVSGVWIGLITAAVVLVLLIIFIAQNTSRASIHFLGWSGHLSLGLLMLIATVCGLLIAALPGTIRILQLRRSLKRVAAERM